jgi:16S rRNA G527 N7-methylase RsmG
MNSSNIPPNAATLTTADCTTAPASVEKSKRGPVFTNAEDVIVARAFIAASEDTICGAHLKGKAFKLNVFELYKELINEQNRANQTLLEQSSNATRDEYLNRGVVVLSLCRIRL